MAADQAQAVIAVIAIVPSAGKVVQVNGQLTNTVSLDDATGALLRGLLQHAAPKLEMIALGSPYVAQEFPVVQNYLCTFSNERVSEISAVKGLFGSGALSDLLLKIAAVKSAKAILIIAPRAQAKKFTIKGPSHGQQQEKSGNKDKAA